MNLQNFINKPEFNNLHPLKQKILKELGSNQMMSSPEALLPQLMAINQELAKRNLSFSKQETALLINALKEDLSPTEKQKIDVLLGLFQF